VKTTDEEIMCALIGQVSKARDAIQRDRGGCCPETVVTTVISRPMWDAFCRATGTPVGTAPTPWLGLGHTHRVYGSETHIMESDEMYAFSY
jgi:hypothetical protein